MDSGFTGTSAVRWQTLPVPLSSPLHHTVEAENTDLAMEQTRQRPISIRISAGEAIAETSTQPSASTSSAAGGSSLSEVFFRRLSRQNSAAGEASPSTQATTAEPATTAAENAEIHRLTSSTTLDLQAFANWFEELFPYFILLGCIFVFYYHIGVFVLCILLRGVLKTNSVLRHQVALKKELDLLECFYALANIVLYTAGVCWLASAQFWRQLLFLPPRYPLTVWEALFTTAIVDTLVRFAAMLPKFAVVMVMYRRVVGRPGYRQQAHMLTFIEYLVTSYRTALPTSVWYLYFVQSAHTGHEVVASLLTGAYLSLKLMAMLKILKLVGAAFKLMMRGGAAYGSYASKEEICEAGNMCAICQDQMDTAAKLECGHIFCESCISEWLERDRTCPMCRAEVKPAGLQSFGDGSTPLLPFLF